MNKIPFEYGSIAENEYFIDRIEDRRDLKTFLGGGINVMLISPRRWGKSSLVKAAMEELKQEQKDIRVCYLDAFKIFSEEEFYNKFASAVLQGVSSTIEDLGRELLKKNFRVSRATLYNTLHLFLELRLVVKHSLADGTKYEASYSEDNHVHQVCTICGKVTEIVAPQVTAAVKDIRMQRFRKDAYALYIYGVCSGCQSKMTRKRKKE